MIKIISCDERVISTVKKITFTYDGQEYYATLFWSEYDGTELTFTDNKGGYLPDPAWLDNYDDGQTDLAWDLDRLGDEILRGTL